MHPYIEGGVWVMSHQRKNHPPDSQVGHGINLVSVVVARMVQVMADAGSKEDTEITLAQDVHQAAGMDQNIPGKGAL